MLDPKLFIRCKAHDRKAQRELYDSYKPVLMGICRRYARSKEDAQDILQEGFIKIFNKLQQVEDAAKVEAWMKSVIVNTAIDHYHKSARNPLAVLGKEEEELPDINYSEILEKLSDEYLIQCINNLPEGCRLVFNLFEVEGYSHEEVAAMLKITVGTSRSQLHYAKHLLKQKLLSLGVKHYEKYA